MPDIDITPADMLNRSVGIAIDRAIKESLEMVEKIGEFPFYTMYPTKYVPDALIMPVPIREGPPVDEKQPIIVGPMPDRRQLVDIDSTESRRRKVFEWNVRNVSHLKGMSKTKEQAVRVTIAKGITHGWSKTELINVLVEKHGLSPAKAKLDAVNEIRRANSWAFRKTGYQLGYRYGKFRIHPGACEVCRAMNGALFPLAEDVIPDRTHPFCRCYLNLSNYGYVGMKEGTSFQSSEVMAKKIPDKVRRFG